MICPMAVNYFSPARKLLKVSGDHMWRIPLLWQQFEVFFTTNITIAILINPKIENNVDFATSLFRIDAVGKENCLLWAMLKT